MSAPGWWAALKAFMAKNDAAHRALPGGWRARVDALYLECSERLEAGSAPQRRQQWQDYERKSVQGSESICRNGPSGGHAAGRQIDSDPNHSDAKS